jgi:hypothetical protein
MVDRYTKGVLTVIAVALTAIAIERSTSPAHAQMPSCGNAGNPCYVSNYGGIPLVVKVEQ